MRLISRRSAGNRRFGPIFLHNRISRGDTRYTGLQALSPAPWQTAAAGTGTDLANLGGRSPSAPHDRVPHCTAASSEAEPFRSSWRSVAAADAGSAGPDTGPNTCTKPGLNLGTRPAPMPAPSGVCTADHKRVSFSQLCGGRAPAGSVRSPAVLSDGGACGVAAVCRRPVKDPPRQFGERAFAGFPWVPTWLCGLVGQMWVCATTSGIVHASAPTALPAASKAQPRRPSLRPKAPSLRRLLRPLLF